MVSNNDLNESLKHFSALTSQIADVKKHLTAQNSQLSSFKKNHVAIQEQQKYLSQQIAEIEKRSPEATSLIEENKRKLSIVLESEESLKNQQSIVDAHIVSLNQNQKDTQEQRQQSLQNIFVALRQTINEYANLQQSLIQFLLLQTLKDMIDEKGLLPSEFNGITEKDYASNVLSSLGNALDTSMKLLTDSEQKDSQDWKDLTLSIASTKQTVKSKEEGLKSLPDNLAQALAQAKADLINFQQQQSEGAQKRRVYKTQANLALGVALVALIVSMPLVVSGIFPSLFLLIIFFVGVAFFISSNKQLAKLDYTKKIQNSQIECERLENECVRMSKTTDSLEADKQFLQKQQKKLDEIHVRHPELRDFHLPQF